MAKGSWKEDNTLNKYCEKEPRLNRICLFEDEDIDWYWEEAELKEIAKMWKQNLSVNYMAKQFKRDPDEVVLAILHLARKEKIQRRKIGLLG